MNVIVGGIIEKDGKYLKTVMNQMNKLVAPINSVEILEV